MPSRPLYPVRDSTPRGTVYLLHFETPFRHARHYIGFSTQVDNRLEAQLRGNGSRLVRAVIEAGIHISLAVEIPDQTLRDEIRIKNWGSAVKWCPICKQERTKNGKE